MKDNYWPAFLVALAIAAGYFIMQKEVVPGPVPTGDAGSENQEGDLAVNETIEFVSILDKIHPSDIKVVSSEKAVWPDRCLGLALPDEKERCIKAPIKGFRVILEADGKLMIFRTNVDGSSIRRDMAAEKDVTSP